MIGQPALTALAYMCQDTQEIHLIHSMAKYWATGNGSSALDGKEIGFAGDTNEYGDPPTAVMIQEIKAWKWIEVTGCFDDAPGMQGFYDADEKNRGKKWVPPQGSTVEKKELPMMLLVSGVVLGFLAEEPRMPAQLHSFLSGLTIVEPSDLQLALDWTMGACQPVAGTENSPFALDMRPVVSACRSFMKWKFERLNGTIGKATTTPPTTPQPGGAPSPEIQGIFQSMQTLAQNMAKVAEQPPQRAAPIPATEATGAGAEKLKGKIFDEFERAVLMGYSNVTKKEKLQLIWRELQMSKSINIARRNVKKKMEQWSTEMVVPIDPTCHFDKKV